MITITEGIRNKYLNAHYRYGSSIRWLIEDVNGRCVKCYKCGNIANAVVEVKKKFIFENWHLTFRVPICKGHIEEQFPEVEMVPCLIKYKPKEK